MHCVRTFTSPRAKSGAKALPGVVGSTPTALSGYAAVAKRTVCGPLPPLPGRPPPRPPPRPPLPRLVSLVVRAAAAEASTMHSTTSPAARYPRPFVVAVHVSVRVATPSHTGRVSERTRPPGLRPPTLTILLLLLLLLLLPRGAGRDAAEEVVEEEKEDDDGSPRAGTATPIISTSHAATPVAAGLASTSTTTWGGGAFSLLSCSVPQPLPLEDSPRNPPMPPPLPGPAPDLPPPGSEAAKHAFTCALI